MSEGDLRTAFRRLDDLGAIIEIADDAERYRLLAQDFLELSRKGSVPLVVSPTHSEGAKVTEAIRDAKREAGKLGPERGFVQFHNLQWEEPDRRRAENYRDGLMIQFNQNAAGIRRGALFRVAGLDGKGGVRVLDATGRETSLPLEHASRFQVFEEREINLGRGDRIRITRNGNSADGRRLNNGDVFTVAGFSRDGKILLNTGAVLEPEPRPFDARLLPDLAFGAIQERPRRACRAEQQVDFCLVSGAVLCLRQPWQKEHPTFTPMTAASSSKRWEIRRCAGRESNWPGISAGRLPE